MSSTLSNTANGWQDLDLEKDVLIEILSKLSTIDKVKLCSVCQSWKSTIEDGCNPWQQISVTATQASSSAFEYWVGLRHSSITHFIVDRPSQQGLPLISPSRPYLQQLTQLQTYQDCGGVGLSSLEDLQPALQQLEANMVLPLDQGIKDESECSSCQVILEHLTQLTSLKVHASVEIGYTGVPMLVWIHLGDTSSVATLCTTLSPMFGSKKLISIHWSGAFQQLRQLCLSSICSQAQVDAIVQCKNLEKLTVSVNTDNEARTFLDDLDGSYKIDVCKVRQLQKLQVLDLTLVSCYLHNAQYIQCLPALQNLSVSMNNDMSGEVAVLFRAEGDPAAVVQFELEQMQHVKLQMHSVFDVTDCLEGLQLVSRLRSLHVILTHSSSRNPSEAHWAIKSGSVLARAVSLQHLEVNCTSMLIKCLPPLLCTMHIHARKIHIQSHLRVALSQMDECILDAKDVEYLV